MKTHVVSLMNLRLGRIWYLSTKDGPVSNPLRANLYTEERAVHVANSWNRDESTNITAGAIPIPRQKKPKRETSKTKTNKVEARQDVFADGI